ncbi:hypothetical protein KJ641_00805 [Patescibacteria group bacterium]|nr:hypothetical protein [Patescibacteria group bacterium]
MTKPKENKNFALSEFLYCDKLTISITIIGTVTIFALIFEYGFPVYLIYIFMFSMMALSLYRYILFIESKDIKSRKTKEGVMVEMRDKKWLEPKKYFRKVGIFLLTYYCLVGIFYWFSRRWAITQLLIFLGFIGWGWLIKRGIINKK